MISALDGYFFSFSEPMMTSLGYCLCVFKITTAASDINLIFLRVSSGSNPSTKCASFIGIMGEINSSIL